MITPQTAEIFQILPDTPVLARKKALASVCSAGKYIFSWNECFDAGWGRTLRAAKNHEL